MVPSIRAGPPPNRPGCPRSPRFVELSPLGSRIAGCFLLLAFRLHRTVLCGRAPGAGSRTVTSRRVETVMVRQPVERELQDDKCGAVRPVLRALGNIELLQMAADIGGDVGEIGP